MKRILLFSSVIFLLSCDANDKTGVCGDGKNICFELDGNFKSFDARWTETVYGYEIRSLEISGPDTSGIILWMFDSPKTHTTNFNYMFTTGDGGFRIIESGDTISAGSGRIEISNVKQSRISGIFDGSIFIYPIDIDVTNGYLDAIPHQ